MKRRCGHGGSHRVNARGASPVASRVDARRCVSHASLEISRERKRRTREKPRCPDDLKRAGGSLMPAPSLRRKDSRAKHKPTMSPPWIQLTCLVGTVTVCRATKDEKKHRVARDERDARRSAFFFRVGSFFFFRVRPYPGRQRRYPRPARPKSCARSTTVRFVLQTETLRVRALCLFTRFYHHEPACHGVGSPSDRP